MYLAFENSNERDYVTEKVLHALEAGVLPVYLGAPNVAEYVPAGSLVQRRDFNSSAALADHLRHLLATPAAYLRYFEWKRRPLPPAFQQRWSALVGTHAKCRLCRWAFAARHGFRWDRALQRPDLGAPEAPRRAKE